MTALEKYRKLGYRDNPEYAAICPSHVSIDCEGEVECNWDFQSISCSLCWDSDILDDDDD